MGRIRTVIGDIESESINNMLMHEHVLFDIVPPGIEGDRHAPITMQDRWQVNYRSNEKPANALQQDHNIAATELLAFAGDGGELIVDQSVYGLARDPLGLHAASRSSGVHVVACAGLYTAAYLDATVKALDVDALVNRFVSEVTLGIDGTDVRAGLIGEIGCSWPIEPIESRALIAAACASQETGASISVHPGRHPDACDQIIDILLAAGANPERVVLCHMDRTYPNGKGVEALLMRGVNVEWDFFGVEQSHYWMGNVALPTDRERLQLIHALADAGFAERILVSQDICTKTRLLTWGGHGYGHLLRNIVPLMHNLGYDNRLVHQLVSDNPRRLLTLENSFE